jgi:hypothetical protein
MISETETRIRVTRVADATPHALFAILADPRRQVEIDGSGMLQASAESTPITAVGETFTMEMFLSSLGHYRTENHVVTFVPDRSIAWATARVGQPPAGVIWSWDLTPGPDGTTIVHTYDWSGVTDPAVKARVSFPRVPAAKLAETIERLIAAASRPV